jgi:hypothetical protein
MQFHQISGAALHLYVPINVSAISGYILNRQKKTFNRKTQLSSMQPKKYKNPLNIEG